MIKWMTTLVGASIGGIVMGGGGEQMRATIRELHCCSNMPTSLTSGDGDHTPCTLRPWRVVTVTTHQTGY